MSKFTSRQWFAIVGSILLLVSLFFVNRKAPQSDSAAAQPSEHAGNKVDFDQLVKQSEDSLPAEQRQLVDKWQSRLSETNDTIHARVLAHLVKLFDSIQQPIISAYYAEKLADVKHSSTIWIHAGQQFYDYATLSKSAMKDVLIDQAQQCFTNSIKLDSANLDAQVGLGECLVDAGANPMQGIMTIEKVLKKDSNNRNAQIALGKFSIRSGQFPKAIYRFNRVLQIDPNYTEAYLYLAQSYEQNGNKQEAIANLKKYRIFAPDSEVKADIDKYIKEKLENDTTK